jgi:hypothetical protein
MKIPELADLVCALDQLNDRYRGAGIAESTHLLGMIGILEGKIEILKIIEPEINRLRKENVEMRVYLEQYRNGECSCFDELQDENTKCDICPNVDKLLGNKR